MKIVTYPKRCLLVFDLYFGESLFTVELDQDILGNTSNVSIKNSDGNQLDDEKISKAIYEYIISRYQLVYDPEVTEYSDGNGGLDIFPDWDDESHLVKYDPAI